jgi:type 1 fimbria pilin
MSKWIGLLFLLLVAIGLPVTAQAACTLAGNLLQPLVFAFTPYSPPNFDPNVANGTVVASQVLSFSAVSGTGGTLTCGTPGIGLQTRSGTTGAQEGTYMTYPTGIAGVGIRFTTQGGTGAGYGVWPTSVDWGTTPTLTIATVGSVLVEFVKVGPITAGGTIVGELGATYIQNGATKLSSYVVNGGITIKPTVPTCTVQSPSPIAVPMGSAAANAFTGVGTTSSGSGQPFTIQLQCAGGTSGATTKMYITLTDQTNAANVSNALTLSADSTASGVGIQVRNGSTIISYGPDSSAAGNTNQWFVTQAGNEPISIPLTARYVQTGSVVRPGTANARATFTMSYQ